MSTAIREAPFVPATGSAANRAVGRRLAEAIALRGTNVPDVARATGVHKQSVWRYATGQTTHTFLRLALLAKHLDVSLEWLAFGHGAMERASHGS
jgi:transcriptional regulator with XRE-family HTH domain